MQEAGYLGGGYCFLSMRMLSNSAKVLLNDISGLIKRRREFRNCVPRHGFLFLTYRCTSRCQTCSMWKRSSGGGREMGLDEWKIVADKLFDAGVRTVEVYGGDVLLRKDMLIPFLRYLKDLGMVVHMPINAVLLNKELAQLIVKTQIDRLYISMDHLGQKHDKIRGVDGNYNTIVKGIKYLSQARGRRVKPTFVCITTISKMNFQSIPQIIDTAHRLGFDVFEFGSLGEIDDQAVSESAVDEITPDPFFSKGSSSLLPSINQVKTLKSSIRSLKKKYYNSSLSINSANYDICSAEELSSSCFKIKNCYQGRNEITVDPYGNILACPFFSKYVLGNVLNSSINLVWNSPKLEHFRKLQGSGKLKICQYCALPIPRNCDIRRALKGIFYNRIYDKLVTMQY